MVKKIVGDILEEEYDDMYYSMRTKVSSAPHCTH